MKRETAPLGEALHLPSGTMVIVFDENLPRLGQPSLG